AGWRLTGFSEIRRTSRGGGAPWHDNALDEFRLDGQRLWKCNDPLVFNAASCSVPIANTAHGYTTENESWLRIRRFDGSNQRWEVTQRDGTKRVYKPLSEWRGDIDANVAEQNQIGNNSRWLLHEVIDTYGNRVTYDYHIAGIHNGYVARPTSIIYGPYAINFVYMDRTQNGDDWHHVRRFAGAKAGEVVANQRMKLGFVEVRYDGGKVRAYDMGWAAKSINRMHVLKSVREYGNDFTDSGGSVTGGTALPGTQFSYESAWQPPTAVIDNKFKFRETLAIADYDGDGRDEIIQPITKTRQTEVRGGQEAEFDYYFTSDKAWWALSPSGNPFERNPGTDPGVYFASSTVGNGICGHRSVDMTKANRSSKKWFLIDTSKSECVTQNGDQNVIEYTMDVFLASAENGDITVHDQETSVNNSGNGSSYVFLDLTGDGEEEILKLGNRDAIGSTVSGVRHIMNGEMKLFGAWVNPPNMQNFPVHKTGDWNGDGLSDFISVRQGVPYMHLSTGATFERQAVQGLPGNFVNSLAEGSNAAHQVVAGDVNGDGATDLVFVTKSSAHAVHVALSTGYDFLVDGSLWTTNLPGPDTAGSHRIADVNGDGLGDLIFHERRIVAPAPITEHPYPGTAHVLISGGNAFTKTNHTIWRFNGVGDFNGDGVQDLLSSARLNSTSSSSNGNWSTVQAPGAIHVSQGKPPHLITRIDKSLGGATDIVYKSLSDWSNERLPDRGQTVSEVRTHDGLGDQWSTKFSYDGGDYDWKRRVDLGFAQVTTELPTISGESARPTIIADLMQTPSTVGRLDQRRHFDHQGGLVLKVDETYDEKNGLPYRAYNTETRTSITLDGTTRHYKVAREFNGHGMPIWIREHGDEGPADDQRTTYVEYSPNVDDYLVSFPRSRTMFEGLRSNSNLQDALDNNYLVARDIFVYDGETSPATPPVRGGVTELRQWNGSANLSNDVVEERTYFGAGDGRPHVAGQLKSVRDANGNKTDFDYDADYGLFLTTTTPPNENGRDHSTTDEWDPACQQLLRDQTDPNGFTLEYAHDELCRVISIAERMPGATEGNWINVGRLETHRYQHFGDPTNQRVRIEVSDHTSVSPGFWTETRFDGLERT
ncbi:MAG: FG-GAP-like repeat-containing protein, partial [Pseudomonadota bacterium]